MRIRNNLLIVWGLFILLACAAHVRAVVVSNVTELENAVSNANSGGDTEIVLTDGTYTLTDALAIWADGVTVRSQSGSRNGVKIYGQGMYGGVTHIFNVAGTNFTAKDMTIGKVANHAIQIWGNNNSSNTLLSNLRIIDTYEQMVKISYDESSSNCSENGVMEGCLLEYTAGVGPQDYIGGIDGHQTKNWTVRNNVFRYISSPSGDVAEHAVHFWSESQDTLVENNLIIDCDRGVGFGLGSRGHVRGIIRNNMIYHSTTDPGFADVAIGLENASNAKVYNNTVYMANSYSNAIEYRFSGTSGGIIKNNLCNKVITSREGGSADLSNNITNAQASWFINVSGGDLHLASAVAQVVDQGVTISGLTSDYDGDARPQGSGIDIGADEYVTGVSASLTVTSPNGGETWTGGSTHAITWTSTGTVGNVKIQYSTNSGGNWSSVISSTANDGYFSWLIPSVNSSACLVRISEASDDSPQDTSNGVFSITTASTGDAVIDINRDQLNFGADVTGNHSASQTFNIENSGTGTMNWSVTDNAAWLSCSPASGSDAGLVTVSVDPSGLDTGTYTGVITVASADASNSPQTVAVTLNVYCTCETSGPFGQYATPDNGAVVSSSVPFTGWALDDIGVESVKLYRKSGSSMVYIGDAVFVEGARPDVEAAFPDYPNNYRAGWGYMMLTNFLPDGGNGTFTIYAFAVDTEGNEVNLGGKTITCDNANAVKPFGAIDTPTQGGSANGASFRNHGWVLTPMPNAVPTDGSTIGVVVDGVSLGHPVYNIYRSDIASLFPGYANSDGAAAYFDIDTTAYANGVHTIAWSAVDDAGNTDGIGSRYFTIQNSGSSSRGNPSWLPDSVHGRLNPAWLPESTVRFRDIVDSPADEVMSFAIRELQRITIPITEQGECAGFMVVGDQLRPLPVGSTLDRERGIFYWLPGPGFIGEYQFVFIIKEGIEEMKKTEVKVSILPLFEKQ